MSHDNQRPPGHDSDGGEEFSTENHGASDAAVGGDDPYEHAGRQSWENQPAPLNDEFGDPEAAEEESAAAGDEDEVVTKSRGRLMLPLLLFVLAMGAGGFAYWQFGMKSGDAAVPAPRADAPVPTPEAQQQVAVDLPTATPPVPAPQAAETAATPAFVGDAGTAASVSSTTSPTAEASASAGVVLAPATPLGTQNAAALQESPAEIVAAKPPETTIAPAALPAPPMPDLGAAESLVKPAETAVSLSETPSIALNQKPPVIDMPATSAVVPPHALAETDSKAAKKALESDVTDLKQTVTSLNEKLQQMKVAAAHQDAALQAAQTALKAAQATAKIELEKPLLAADTPKIEKAKKPQHAVVHKNVAAKSKKLTAKKPTKKSVVAASKSKKVTPKKAIAQSSPQSEKWELRSVAAGTAWISSAKAENELKEVHVGDVVPGVGTVKAITSQDGHWIIEGSLKNLK